MTSTSSLLVASLLTVGFQLVLATANPAQLTLYKNSLKTSQATVFGGNYFYLTTVLSYKAEELENNLLDKLEAFRESLNEDAESTDEDENAESTGKAENAAAAESSDHEDIPDEVIYRLTVEENEIADFLKFPSVREELDQYIDELALMSDLVKGIRTIEIVQTHSENESKLVFKKVPETNSKFSLESTTPLNPDGLGTDFHSADVKISITKTEGQSLASEEFRQISTLEMDCDEEYIEMIIQLTKE